MSILCYRRISFVAEGRTSVTKTHKPRRVMQYANGQIQSSVSFKLYPNRLAELMISKQPTIKVRALISNTFFVNFFTVYRKPYKTNVIGIENNTPINKIGK